MTKAVGDRCCLLSPPMTRARQAAVAVAMALTVIAFVRAALGGGVAFEAIGLGLIVGTVLLIRERTWPATLVLVGIETTWLVTGAPALFTRFPLSPIADLLGVVVGVPLCLLGLIAVILTLRQSES